MASGSGRRNPPETPGTAVSPARPAILRISEAQRAVLARVVEDESTRPAELARARAALLAASGVANATLAAEFGISPTTALAWRRAFASRGLASLAERGDRPGRPGSIPGMRLASAADALTRNEHAPQPASTRELAVRLGVSASTLGRIRADLRIGQGSTAPPRHHLAEVVGVLVDGPVAAVAVALDPGTHRVFMRSRRGPHMRGSCPGGLVAAMSAVDLLRERHLEAVHRREAVARRAARRTAGARVPGEVHAQAEGRAQEEARTQEETRAQEEARAQRSWTTFLTRVAEEWPTGAHVHVIVTGPVEAPGHHGATTGTGRALLRVRHTSSAAWAHGRRILIARVLRAAGSRGNLRVLPELVGALEAEVEALPAGRRRPRRVLWVAPRERTEAAARRSRADLLERTRGF